MRIALFSLILLTLAGCRTLMDPTFMPAGYRHHQETYKSPPGPTAHDIGYAYTEAQNAHVIATWEDVANDLVEALVWKQQLSPQPVYLRNDLPVNAFNTSFDHALREAFRSRGFMLVNSPDRVLSVSYEAYLPEDEKISPRDEDFYATEIEDAAKPRVFIFALQTVLDGQFKGQTILAHKVPSFGYVRGQGRVHNVKGSLSPVMHSIR